MPVGDGERPEVVHADERLCGLLHPLHAERLLHPPDVGLGEGGAARGHLIEVAARHGVVSGVEAVRHDLRREDVDIGGQFVVHLAPQ